jgi:hypothetical protein
LQMPVGVRAQGGQHVRIGADARVSVEAGSAGASYHKAEQPWVTVAPPTPTALTIASFSSSSQRRLNFLFGLGTGSSVLFPLILLIIVITLIAIGSIIEGGVKVLSEINMGLAGLLLLFVIIAGPTVAILTASSTTFWPTASIFRRCRGVRGARRLADCRRSRPTILFEQGCGSVFVASVTLREQSL